MNIRSKIQSISSHTATSLKVSALTSAALVAPVATTKLQSQKPLKLLKKEKNLNLFENGFKRKSVECKTGEKPDFFMTTAERDKEPLSDLKSCAKRNIVMMEWYHDIDQYLALPMDERNRKNSPLLATGPLDLNIALQRLLENKRKAMDTHYSLLDNSSASNTLGFKWARQNARNENIGSVHRVTSSNTYIQVLLYTLLFSYTIPSARNPSMDSLPARQSIAPKKSLEPIKLEDLDAKKLVFTELWQHYISIDSLHFTHNTRLAFLQAFGVVQDKFMVEKIHNLLVKNRSTSTEVWSSHTYEILMFAHGRCQNWRAVKRLFEEYEKEHFPQDFNTTKPSLSSTSTRASIIQSYLEALEKSENLSYLVAFTSKHYGSLSLLSLTGQTYETLFRVSAQLGRLDLCRKWFSALKKTLMSSVQISGNGLGNGGSGREGRETSHVAIEYTILYKALDAFVAVKAPLDILMEVFHDIKRIRRLHVKQSNTALLCNYSPIHLSSLYEKSIRGEALDAHESTILSNHRAWKSPVMPLKVLATTLRSLSTHQSRSRIYSFFQEQVCTKEFLTLYWTRQLSLYKRRAENALTLAQDGLEAITPLSSTTPLHKNNTVSRDQWLKRSRDTRHAEMAVRGTQRV